ncbi:MAG: zonular occludens toxin domain-containing protein [Acidithiobacillus sp.]
MITIRTGLPGAGKTLFSVHDYIARPPLGSAPVREVYVSGIDLVLDMLPFIPLDEPTRWMDCPPGSLVVIDECQRFFRNRPPGAPVPDYVAALETHRHLGIDLVLITQDPMLIDKHVRRLAGEHFHAKRTFGLSSITMYRWQRCVDDPLDFHTKKEAEKVRRKYPKKIYKCYKSAEIHTVKRKIPFRVWATFAVLLALGPIGWFAYHHISGMFAADVATFHPGQHLVNGAVVPSSSSSLSSPAPAPLVFRSTHPLQDFVHDGLKLKRVQAQELPGISEKFRIVGHISNGPRSDYVLVSQSKHYVTVPASHCLSEDGLEVCRFAGAYVSVDPTRGRVRRKRRRAAHPLLPTQPMAANVLP